MTGTTESSGAEHASLGERVRRVRDHARVFGVLATARALAARLAGASTSVPDRFDERHAVDTEGVMGVEDSDLPERARDQATPYQPTHERVLRDLLRSLPIPPGELVFYDLGCGKGRVVLLASLRPFRRVVGVELSAALTRAARGNLERFRQREGARVRCADVEIREGDLGEFGLPEGEGDQVVYLFNPSRLPVLERFFDRLRDSLRRAPRRVLVAVTNPGRAPILLRDRGFEEIAARRTLSRWWSWSLFGAGNETGEGDPRGDRRGAC